MTNDSTIIKMAANAALTARLRHFRCVDQRTLTGYTVHEYPIPGQVTDACIRCGHIAATEKLRVDNPRPISSHWCNDCRTKTRCRYHRWALTQTVTTRVE